MLSSITPLGQRARGGSWLRTVVAFWIGATFAGALVFGAVGFAGSLIEVGSLNPWYSLVVLLAAGILDMLKVRPPGPQRQVDEDWLGRYRDWVVGLGFGAQLGAGFATIIPSFGTWALYALALGAGTPLAAGIGVAFGVGRSLLLVMTRTIGHPFALTDRMRAFAAAESRARLAPILGFALVIVTGVISVA